MKLTANSSTCTDSSENNTLRYTVKQFPNINHLPTNQPICVHVFFQSNFESLRIPAFQLDDYAWTHSVNKDGYRDLASGNRSPKVILPSPLAWCSILPVESAPEAGPLICSSVLMTCRSVYEGPQLGLLVSSECVVQLLSEVGGHLPRELKEGHIQQGMVNGGPGDRPETKSIQYKQLCLVYL